MNYKEQLKDPRWQKKRLETFERDNWTCQMCWDKESPLAAHHKLYIKGRMAWEYDKEIITLCDDCHDRVHMLEKDDKVMVEVWVHKTNITDWLIYKKRLRELIDSNKPSIGISIATQLIMSQTIRKENI